MNKELPKTYDPKTIDPKWQKFWAETDLFQANSLSDKPPFCIIMPPPNVTGILHMGHALVSTLQDIIIRWKRMLGFEVLWFPGTDHAGISTQTVVEKHLMKTLGKKRTEFTREEFLQHVWKWKDENEHYILQQLKKIGSSCDWSRLRFTMDAQSNRAVRVMFKKMFDEGLIYRGDYLVNWDPVTQTAIADDEVEYEERQSFLWYIRYPLQDGSGHLTIATTRPETMLGDTAVAVAPHDERYSHLIGKTAILPLMNREIPIISDRRVDPAFGTGMVKITPAHDPNDYQIGLDHKLPFMNIMTPDGKINERGGHFKGMSMQEAREAVLSELGHLALLAQTIPHTHRVGLSYRSKAVVEPYMSKQWFVKMAPFAPKLKSAIAQGRVKMIPDQWISTYFHWIDNLRDWCISRQLWWGHQIPIWYSKKNGQMLCYDGEGVPPEVASHPESWEQDHDVLDTWFSSGLWPFSTLGWPDKTQDIAKFYPTSVLITGHDILFFWVARMILMGEYAMHLPPFQKVFLHGLIYGKSYWRNQPGGGITYITDQERHNYDKGTPIPDDVFSKWEKMSKSKGNIIDPMEIIEEFGTDAMRMGLCSAPTQSREIDLDRRRFEDFKNFANKVWNGARFVLMNLEGLDTQALSEGIDESIFRLEDRWILSVLSRTIQSVNQKLEDYHFDQAAMEAYNFFWSEFCAYYVEIAKPTLFGKEGSFADKKNKQKILLCVLCQAIRLLHPMAPFITEELFHVLQETLLTPPSTKDAYLSDAISSLRAPSCALASYPQPIKERDIALEETFDRVCQSIYTIRNIRGEMKLPPGVETDIHIIGEDQDPLFCTLRENQNIVRALTRVQNLYFASQQPTLEFASTTILHSVKIFIPMPQELVEKEKARLSKEQEKLTKTIEKLRQQLDNVDFVQRAPQHLIDKHKEQLRQSESQLSELSEKLTNLTNS